MRRLVPFLAILLASAAAFLVSRVEQVRVLESALYDEVLTRVETSPRDPRIVVIGIDEASLEALGPFPWPRSVHGRLLRVLKARGAHRVFFDLVFDTPGARGEQDDLEFARALKETGIGVLAVGVGEEDARDNRVSPLLPMFEENAAVGVINRKRDPDGVLRWGILAVAAVDPPAPSAALQLFRTGREGEPVEYRADSLKVGTTVIPTSGSEPFEVPIRYRSPRQPVSYARVLAGDLEGVPLEGALVLVGLNVQDPTVDTFETPLGPRKGVEVHAAILDTLLGGQVLRRVGPGWDFLATLAMCSLVGFLVRRSPGVGIGAAATALAVGAGLGLGLFLFRQGCWFGIVGPVLGAGLGFGTAWALRLRQVRSVFTQFVAAAQVGEMLKSDEAARLGGTERVATVFFTDIRGYTTLSESRTPVEVMDMLNEYHSRVGDIYAQRGGTVMTYQGDAQIVLFGHLGPQDDVARARSIASAVQAGLEMQGAVEDLRQRWAMRPGERFEVGVGICTGPVAVALVGSEAHKQFTVLGDTVRMASEVQGLSASLEAPVIMDQASRDAAGSLVQADALDPVAIKGQSQPMFLYRATGVSVGALR